MVVEDIADNCCGDTDSTILEIGPGIGSLTNELAKRYREVVALEIDSSLIPVLAYTLGEHKNVKVINQDVMKTDLDELLGEAFKSSKVSVCANLPYYITTPILMKLLKSRLPFEYITIMIQSEVADRLCARAGSKDFGAITAVLNYYGEAERLFDVTADNFVPAPKVDSAVVRIDLYKEKPYRPVNEACFFRTVKAAFEQRRKTLPNSLMTGFSSLGKEKITEVIESCGHPANIRGEKLSTEDFVRLSDALYAALTEANEA
jgi:16S rRNA (adenine1518-N6/adenine1519-N6)-dimethyltransferase